MNEPTTAVSEPSASPGPADSGSETLALVLTEIERLLPDLAGAVTETSSFDDDLEMDSLHVNELIARLESWLGRGIPEEVEATAQTPRELADRLVQLGAGVS